MNWHWWRRHKSRSYQERFNDGGWPHYFCPCCGDEIKDLRQSHKTRWWSLGSGYAVCDRHPVVEDIRHRRWEDSTETDLPIVHWAPEAKASWAANEKEDILAICGIPKPQWSIDLDRKIARMPR